MLDPIMDRSSSVPTSSESALAAYEKLIRPARDRSAATPGVQAITSQHVDARTMAAFLLHFSALSIPITEPVEGWIRRAGEGCHDGGLHDLGRALQKHAEAEAGHHLYHRDDFDALVTLWNQHWGPTIRAADVTTARITRGGERYCALHEANIRGRCAFLSIGDRVRDRTSSGRTRSAVRSKLVRLLGPDGTAATTEEAHDGRLFSAVFEGGTELWGTFDLSVTGWFVESR